MAGHHSRTAPQVDSPAAIARDIQYVSATFGEPLPETILSAKIVYAVPHHACRALENAAEVEDNIVMIDRGPSSATECPFPGRYFANKVAAAQDAKAKAVVMVNGAMLVA